MCGRFAFMLVPEAMGRFAADLRIDLPPARYNIAPTQPVLAIWQDESGRAARLARWGLVPAWVKDPREFPLLVNARAETIASKPAFRDSLKHHRCIVPASGYYEWRRDTDGPSQPFFIHATNGDPLAMAGLWSTWIGPEGEEVDTLAVLTVPANDEIKTIHHRMPALLAEADFDSWLDVRGHTGPEAMGAIRPAEQGVLAFHPVSRRVNSAANDGPDLIAPAAPEPAPAPKKKPSEVKRKDSGQYDLF
ncbi:SOS response-associated peptidase [Pelagibacterium montanilacus]|uniref:SOS response-associated peptidase n=1 Tax=Pelagibacterium montanilacus TaxID=2185280 RepID=UPI000F8E9260|nr:SOS response-associated peptidase [Pelagibacterium montanilacus]